MEDYNDFTGLLWFYFEKYHEPVKKDTVDFEMGKLPRFSFF